MGLDEALGYRRSRLPIAAFLFGLLGTLCALTLQISMMTVDWPMNIGGKDFLSIPTFIPVTFEMTVLLAAFGMVSVFFIASNLKPWGQPTLFHPRQTDDRHIIVIPVEKQLHSREKIQTLLQDLGSEADSSEQST